MKGAADMMQKQRGLTRTSVADCYERIGDGVFFFESVHTSAHALEEGEKRSTNLLDSDVLEGADAVLEVCVAGDEEHERIFRLPV